MEGRRLAERVQVLRGATVLATEATPRVTQPVNADGSLGLLSLSDAVRSMARRGRADTAPATRTMPARGEVTGGCALARRARRARPRAQGSTGAVAMATLPRDLARPFPGLRTTTPPSEHMGRERRPRGGYALILGLGDGL